MLRTFLAATNETGRQAAFEQMIARVAELYRARLLVAVVRDSDSPASTLPAVASENRQEVEARAADTEPRVQPVILIGDFLSVVCDKGHEADVIVVWRGCLSRGEGQDAAERLARLIREAPRPVWLGREPFKFPEHIVVAYDGSAHAGRALHMGANLAETLGARLTVLHVDESRDDVAQELILARAAGYCEPYRIKMERVGINGSAATAIRDYSESTQCDLLVVGATGVGYLRGLLFGSVAAQLIANAQCSVLVAK